MKKILVAAAALMSATAVAYPQMTLVDKGKPKAQIVIAEDNEINMEIADEMLTSQGAHVTRAWNGEEAVERFREAPPFTFDAVLLDMQMPVMDGCEAARQIRALQRPDAGTVPIIAVTANAFAEDVAATTEAGMNAHIAKPIELAALQRVLGGIRPAP